MNQTILLLPGVDSTRLVSTNFSFQYFTLSIVHIFCILHLYRFSFFSVLLVLINQQYFELSNHSEVNITYLETIGQCCQVQILEHLVRLAGLSSDVDFLHLPACLHCLKERA